MVVKVIKTDFIQDSCDRGKETLVQNWLNSQYNMNKWEFVAKGCRGESGGQSMDGKLLRGNIGTKGGFWLSQLDRILAEGRPEWSNIKDSSWAMWLDNYSDQKSTVWICSSKWIEQDSCWKWSQDRPWATWEAPNQTYVLYFSCLWNGDHNSTCPWEYCED